MKTVEIIGANAHEHFEKTRIACRGIIIENGQILLTYEENTDQWFIPGGGLEGDETLAQCCIRELAEETGFLVNVGEHFLTLEEYYAEWRYESHYFVCERVGETERKLTEGEKKAGLVPRWIDLSAAVETFSRHQEYAQISEMKRGGYLREYKALLAFLEVYAKYTSGSLYSRDKEKDGE